MDIPDLPLVLQLLAAGDSNRPYQVEVDHLIERYCLERGISANYLGSYLSGLNRYYEAAFEKYGAVDFIGFSVWTSNLLSTLLAAHHLKRRSNPPFIVAGGPQLTESPASAELALRSGLFDAVAQGEGKKRCARCTPRSRRTGAGGFTASLAPNTSTRNPVSWSRPQGRY